MKIKDVEIEWLGHSGFRIKSDKVIYIDPYNIKEDSELADFVLITHGHQDHCSFPDLKKIVKEGTRIIIPADCQSKINKFTLPLKVGIVEPNQELSFGDLKVITFPAYNVDKHFHPKEESWMGYILRIGDVIVYHSGDTDFIPEMQKLTGYKQPGKEFISLLTIGGRFSMNAEEAAEAAKLIKPNTAIPMGWGSVIGTMDDAIEFVELCKENKINAIILEKG